MWSDAALAGVGVNGCGYCTEEPARGRDAARALAIRPMGAGGALSSARAVSRDPR